MFEHLPPLLLCLLGGLRSLAQSGAPWLRRGVDHCHKFTGGNPYLPAAGCAALEGESGDCGGPHGAPTHRCTVFASPEANSLGRNFLLGLSSWCRYSGGRAGPPAGSNGILVPLEATHNHSNISASLHSYPFTGPIRKVGA